MPRTPQKPATSAVKNTKGGAAPKKPRLSQAEAEARMLSAASQLLLTHPPADVTVHMITDQAGVHHDYVARYFGSREEVMIQAIEKSLLGIILTAEGASKDGITTALGDNVNLMAMAAARTRVINYLLACGVSPERFQTSQKMILEFGLKAFTNPNIKERTKVNFALIAMMLVQAMSTLDEVNSMTELQKADVRDFIANIGLISEQIQSALHWDKPGPKKRKKT